MKKLNLKGFTLVELLVVISIISILASIVIVGTNGARIRARDTRRLADVKSIQNALDLYFNANKKYPTISKLAGCNNGNNVNYNLFMGLKKQLVTDNSYLPSMPNDPSYSGTVDQNDFCAASNYWYWYDSATSMYNLEFATEEDKGTTIGAAKRVTSEENCDPFGRAVISKRYCYKIQVKK